MDIIIDFLQFADFYEPLIYAREKFFAAFTLRAWICVRVKERDTLKHAINLVCLLYRFHYVSSMTYFRFWSLTERSS